MITVEHKVSFEEITSHLMEDEKPSNYINEIARTEIFNEYPFHMLQKLKTTEQSKKYHPEGSVWNHTMLVLDEAAKVRTRSKEPKEFMWAALLHDIGKPATTRIRKEKITSYDHDTVGERLCREFLKELGAEEEFVRKVSALVRYHMHILYLLKGLPYADRSGLAKNVDAEDIALLCKCDRLGRTGADVLEEEAQYREFLRRIKQIKH
jgi:putative nucleotidyltransferase with HDIG domain